MARETIETLRQERDAARAAEKTATAEAAKWKSYYDSANSGRDQSKSDLESVHLLLDAATQIPRALPAPTTYSPDATNTLPLYARVAAALLLPRIPKAAKDEAF